MNADQLQTIAQDATFQVQCAMCQIDWLRSVLHVLEDRLNTSGDKHGANLANLAIYNADDWHNALDDQRGPWRSASTKQPPRHKTLLLQNVAREVRHEPGHHPQHPTAHRRVPRPAVASTQMIDQVHERPMARLVATLMRTVAASLRGGLLQS